MVPRQKAGHMTACHPIVQNIKKSLANRGRSLIAPLLSMVLSPPRVTVLSAVGIIRRNIWSEAQALQGPQRAGVQ